MIGYNGEHDTETKGFTFSENSTYLGSNTDVFRDVNDLPEPRLGSNGYTEIAVGKRGQVRVATSTDLIYVSEHIGYVTPTYTREYTNKLVGATSLGTSRVVHVTGRRRVCTRRT